MNSLPSRAAFGGSVVLVATVLVAAFGSPSLSAAFVLAALTSGLACVAFAAQSRRLSEADRLVYRPVYARRQSVQRRVRLDD